LDSFSDFLVFSFRSRTENNTSDSKMTLLRMGACVKERTPIPGLFALWAYLALLLVFLSPAAFPDATDLDDETCPDCHKETGLRTATPATFPLGHLAQSPPPIASLSRQKVPLRNCRNSAGIVRLDHSVNLQSKPDAISLDCSVRHDVCVWSELAVTKKRQLTYRRCV
jgi:hypothetical protein